MNEHTVESLAEASARSFEVYVGDKAANGAISDAFICAVLKAFPPLTASVREHLALTQQHHAEPLREEGDLARRVFDLRIQEFRALLEAMPTS